MGVQLSLSRYELALKQMLEDQIQGNLDATSFPFTRPHTSSGEQRLHWWLFVFERLLDTNSKEVEVGNHCAVHGSG
jgi:hypothetical protein